MLQELLNSQKLLNCNKTFIWDYIYWFYVYWNSYKLFHNFQRHLNQIFVRLRLFEMNGSKHVTMGWPLAHCGWPKLAEWFDIHTDQSSLRMIELSALGKESDRPPLCSLMSELPPNSRAGFGSTARSTAKHRSPVLDFSRINHQVDPARSLGDATLTTSSLKNSWTCKFLIWSRKNNTRKLTSLTRPHLYN